GSSPRRAPGGSWLACARCAPKEAGDGGTSSECARVYLRAPLRAAAGGLPAALPPGVRRADGAGLPRLLPRGRAATGRAWGRLAVARDAAGLGQDGVRRAGVGGDSHVQG